MPGASWERNRPKSSRASGGTATVCEVGFLSTVGSATLWVACKEHRANSERPTCYNTPDFPAGVLPTNRAKL